MVLLDTNVLIYIANGTLPSTIIGDASICHASITKIEALGYGALPANELLLITELFSESFELDLTRAVVELAIRLRQTKTMSLGDSIIAATAIEHNIELWTGNTEDFRHIAKLKLINPLLLGDRA